MKQVLETSNEQLKASDETKQAVKDFLATHQTGVLSTTDDDGGPRAAVVYFSVRDDFSITFATKKETKKHANLQRDPRAMFVVYEESSQSTVQVQGHAEVITDPGEAKRVIDQVANIASTTSESGELAVSKLEAGGFVAYQLLPAQIRMAVFARPDPGGYDIFETIYFDAA